MLQLGLSGERLNSERGVSRLWCMSRRAEKEGRNSEGMKCTSARQREPARKDRVPAPLRNKSKI